jgi:hypothetical protein
MKKCKKCGEEKEESTFYKSRNDCKECVKKMVRANRLAKIDYYREYDRARGNRQPSSYLKDYRERNPNKYRAHNIVNNSIRDGKLFAEPCCVCGSTVSVHAHHDDYSKPLNVRWLCAAHHKQWHDENGEGLNA